MVLNFLAAVSLLTGASGAQSAQPPRAPAAPTAAERLRQAEQATATVELGRILNDRPYAEGLLRDIDLVLTAPVRDPQRRLALESVRALVLGELDRKEEAKALIARLLSAEPDQADAYTLIWAAASHLRDLKLMVGTIEGMARTLGTADPAPIFEMLPPDLVFALASLLREEELTEERVRLAESLIAMGWQRAEPALLNSFRLFLIDRYLSEGRRGDAERLAREVVGPHYLLQLLIAKRYEGLLPTAAGDDLLRLTLAEDDRGTASKLAASPRDLTAVQDRIAYLRGVARNEEAVALARPWLADVPATIGKDEDGVWIVNGAAFALVALGRPDEALAAMRSLAEVDIDAYPQADLIGPMINYAGLLWQVGRPAESLAYIERLGPLAAEHANEYGRMWVAGHAVCAHAALGRSAEAATALRQLQAQPKINESALNMALLCMGDLDASERLVIQRLGSDNPAEMLLSLQLYRMETSEGVGLDAVRKRFDAVRERPAVRAAAERVGRILTLPIDRTYYGSF